LDIENIKNILKNYYIEILGREPDEDGLHHYLQEIMSKKISIAELPEIFRNSQEYKLKNPLEIQDTISTEKRMERDWDERAKSDIKFAIRSVDKQSEKEFWGSGESDCNDIILGKNTKRFDQILNNKNPKEMKILEIGCGIGRLLIPMSNIFGTVYGVDVSNKMIEECSMYVKDISNCNIQKNNGSDLLIFQDNFFDFCFSFIVFQHIPDKSIILNYFQEVSRILKPNSIFRIQLSAMNENTQINTWNGVHFTLEEVHELATKTDFMVIEESGMGTKYYWLTLKKQKNTSTLSSNYESKVKDLYKKILLRDPDKTGLFYFTSQLKNKKLTLSEIEKILLDSEEGKSINSFSHYSDKYWNDIPRVARYKNKLSTDDEHTHWIDDILKRFKEFIPFGKVLIVGCGNGWLERKLFDMGIGNTFDAFDISEKYIQESIEKKGNRSITYFIDDINNLQKIKSKTYDAIFNFAILHHATEIDSAMKKLADSLKENGLIFNEEYVGPARNQYSDEHLQIMLEVMSDLPERFRTKYSLRPPLANFRVEPSEAIHSDLVIPTFKKYFDTIYERNMNGGIAYQILWNNIEPFENSNDPEAEKWLEYLLEKDLKFSKEGKVSNLFWYGVGKPKNSKILNE